MNRCQFCCTLSMPIKHPCGMDYERLTSSAMTFTGSFWDFALAWNCSLAGASSWSGACKAFAALCFTCGSTSGHIVTVAKPKMRSTSLCYELHVYMIVAMLSNSIFAGTKAVMLSYRQVFTKSAITWASYVSWLEPKIGCKAQDKIYASMIRICYFIYVFFFGQIASLRRSISDLSWKIETRLRLCVSINVAKSLW